MKKRSNNKKANLEVNSFKNGLFKKLTDKELKEINGGQATTTLNFYPGGDALEFSLGKLDDY